MARRLNCDLHLPTSHVERHAALIAIITPTRGFPQRFVPTSFNFLDDRTIGCKKRRDTRACAPVMRMPLLAAATNVASWPAMATALMDAQHDDVLKILARDRNLTNACQMVPGDACQRSIRLFRSMCTNDSDLQHARIEPDSDSQQSELRERPM
jgi:hypothetical protein